MTEIPESFGGFSSDEGSSVDALYNTIQNFCNESTLTRAAIIGVLEAVKFSLFVSWDREGEEND